MLVQLRLFSITMSFWLQNDSITWSSRVWEDYAVESSIRKFRQITQGDSVVLLSSKNGTILEIWVPIKGKLINMCKGSFCFYSDNLVIAFHGFFFFLFSCLPHQSPLVILGCVESFEIRCYNCLLELLCLSFSSI